MKIVKNKRLQKKLDKKIQELKENKIAKFLLAVGLLAFILAIYSCKQYNLTIIDFKHVVYVHLFASVVFGALTYNYKQKLSPK
jgi:hypothetical protein